MAADYRPPRGIEEQLERLRAAEDGRSTPHYPGLVNVDEVRHLERRLATTEAQLAEVRALADKWHEYAEACANDPEEPWHPKMLWSIAALRVHAAIRRGQTDGWGRPR